MSACKGNNGVYLENYVILECPELEIWLASPIRHASMSWARVNGVTPPGVAKRLWVNSQALPRPLCLNCLIHVGRGFTWVRVPWWPCAERFCFCLREWDALKGALGLGRNFLTPMWKIFYNWCWTTVICSILGIPPIVDNYADLDLVKVTH